MTTAPLTRMETEETRQERNMKEVHYNDWPNTQGFDVEYEEHSIVELKVDGTIPAYAAGTLFRTGLGVRDIEAENGKLFRVNHWFDNLAQVHRFQIHAPDPDADGKVRVTYNSRSTCDGLIENIKKTGQREGVTFGAKYDPCMAVFQKASSKFTPGTPPLTPPTMKPPTNFNPRKRPTKADELSVAVAVTANFPALTREGVASRGAPAGKGKVENLCNHTDTDAMQFLDPETLEPIGVASQATLHPLLKGPSSATHACTDPKTGDLYNYNLEFGRGQGLYRVFGVKGSTGKTSILATITDEPAYLHSLMLTEHFVVLCIWNAVYAHGGASVLWTKNIVDALASYDPERPCKWYVVDRTPPEEGGRGLVATYESDPFFCFHTVNAYEETTEDGELRIIADLIAYRDLDILKRLYIDNLLSNSSSAADFAKYEHCHPNMRRFILPGVPAAAADPFAVPGKIEDREAELEIPEVENGFTAEQLKTPELPIINPGFQGRRHRYVYGVLHTGKSTLWDSIVKHDLETGEARTWAVHGHTPGEPIFVPKPSSTGNADAESGLGNDSNEDKGVLLSVVLDGIKGKSYLLVLDAQTMEEVGRAHVDGVVGFGFHGMHVGASS